MKTKKNESRRGFLVVASRNPNFHKYALNLIESIRDFYPEANICLATEERFLDGREGKLADDVLLTDSHYRAKLWAMSKSPYETTMYVDADIECEHEDVSLVWDELGDRDMVFHELTEERGKFYAVRKFPFEGREAEFSLCGGVCLYNLSNPLVREFMEEWFSLFDAQWNGDWRPEGFDDATWNDLKDFDQTTLWWMTEKMKDKYGSLNIGIFKDDIRWNYFTQYQYENLVSIEGKPPILRHYSGSLHKDRRIV